MLRGLTQSTNIRLSCRYAGLGPSANHVPTTLLCSSLSPRSVKQLRVLDNHIRNFSSFYTAYQDDVSVRPEAPKKVTPPPPPPPAPEHYEQAELEVPTQQLLLLGPQQAGVEAVAYMLAQNYGNSVRHITHETSDSVMEEIARTKQPFILWSDTPDLLARGNLSAIVHSPMLISILLDYPAPQLPPMAELTLDSIIEQSQHHAALKHTLPPAPMRDPLIPSATPSAHEHDSAWMYSDAYDFRVVVNPGDSPAQVFDRITTRMTLSESYISTRGQYTSEGNALASERAQDPENEDEDGADLVGFPQTLETIFDRSGGYFLPDLANPWLLTKGHMFNVNEHGEAEAVADDDTRSTAELARALHAVQTGNDADAEAEADAAPEADFRGMVPDPAFLPQALSRLSELSFPQRLQRVLEALPVGNVPPPYISQHLHQLFFKWDHPAVITTSPMQRRANDLTYDNLYAVQLGLGPTGSYFDLLQGCSSALLQAAIQHNNYMAKLSGEAPPQHRSLGFIGAGNLNNTLAAMVHLDPDQNVAALLPSNAPVPAAPSSYLMDDQQRVPLTRVPLTAADATLLHRHAHDRGAMLGAVRALADDTVNPAVAEDLALRVLISPDHIHRMMRAISSWSTSTFMPVLPAHLYPMAATVLSSYVDLVNMGVVREPADHDDAAIRRRLHAQLQNMGAVAEGDNAAVRREATAVKHAAGINLGASPEDCALDSEEKLAEALPRVYPSGHHARYSPWDWTTARPRASVAASELRCEDLLDQMQPCVADVALSTLTPELLVGALLARDLGAPIRRVLVAIAPQHAALKDLLLKGEVRFELRGVLTEDLLAALERIVFLCSVRNTEVTDDFGQALRELRQSSLYTVDNDAYNSQDGEEEAALQREREARARAKEAGEEEESDDDVSDTESLPVEEQLKRPLYTLPAAVLANMHSFFSFRAVDSPVVTRETRSAAESQGVLLSLDAALATHVARKDKGFIDLTPLRTRLALAQGVAPPRGSALLPVPVIVPMAVHPDREAARLSSLLMRRRTAPLPRNITVGEARDRAVSELLELRATARKLAQAVPMKDEDTHRVDAFPAPQSSLLDAMESPRDPAEQLMVPLLPDSFEVIERIVSSHFITQSGARTGIPNMTKGVKEMLAKQVEARGVEAGAAKSSSKSNKSKTNKRNAKK